MLSNRGDKQVFTSEIIDSENSTPSPEGQAIAPHYGSVQIYESNTSQ